MFDLDSLSCFQKAVMSKKNNLFRKKVRKKKERAGQTLEEQTTEHTKNK